MKSCTKITRAAAASALLLGAVAFSNVAAAQQSNMQQPSDDQPGVMSSSLVTASATVQKVDKAKSEVTLKSPDGRTVDVKAEPDVHLDRLHVGDKVTASFYDEVAVSLQKPSAGPPKMTTKTVQRAGVTATQSTVTARIVSVDPPNKTVVVRGPRGEQHTLKVENPDLQARLTQIKPGDNIDVIYTQAVAVSIEPRKA